MRIVTLKKNLKSAYRRAYLLGFLVALALTVIAGFALISLYLLFRGAYYSYMWYIISELICDLANDLLRCDYWNVDEFNFKNKSLISPLKLEEHPRELAKAL